MQTSHPDPDAALRTDPVLRLHGHNDYLQPVPCTRALELGLGSLEADIYLVDGELCVGHERWQLRPGRTLERLYLDPLRLAVARAGGSLRSDGEPLVLLVDIKADGQRVYQTLRGVLRGYSDMLTRFVDGSIEPGAVTVLLSGSRPTALLATESDRLCALDGRIADLDRIPSPPVDLVPWVSSSWRAISDWTGSDDLMPDEVRRVQSLVAKANRQGRELRFWSAPDRKEGWCALYDLGVHRIGSDQPKNAARWLQQARGGH
ncbi:MAG: hypothetical protein AB8H80_08930 [Planctomycetota bacterium]